MNCRHDNAKKEQNKKKLVIDGMPLKNESPYGVPGKRNRYTIWKRAQSDQHNKGSHGNFPQPYFRVACRTGINPYHVCFRHVTSI